jgi:hypothetical protein
MKVNLKWIKFGGFPQVLPFSKRLSELAEI